MPRAGFITGKVAFADTGELVDDFELSVHARHEFAVCAPGEHGAFDLRDLRPDAYRLHIRGPGFLETHKAARVDAGQRIDVGTITVERGRTLRGTVVDSAGRGIAGASVMLGDYGVLHYVGRGDVPTFDPWRPMTDANGAFAIVGGIPINPQRLVVGADHPPYGRALPVAIPPGTQDPPPVTLTLLECGRIAGKVTRNGQPLYSVLIDAGSPAVDKAMTNDDGEFAMSRVPAGSVALCIRVLTDPVDTFLHVHQRTVQVEAGKQTDVMIEVPAGSIKLSVVVTHRPGVEVAAAELYLFRGTVAFEHYAELLTQLLGDLHGRAYWEGDASHPAFEHLVPGDYTVCALPLAGSRNDHALMKRVSSNSASVKVYCTPVRVATAPEEQTVTVEVPAMVWA
jgi:hypothetical protein